MQTNRVLYFFTMLFLLVGSQRISCAQEGLPAGWTRGGNALLNYQITVDEAVKHGGKASAQIQFTGTAANGFVSLTHTCSAEAYRGKRVRLSAWVKTAAVGDHVQLWFRLDAPTRMPGFDNMSNRPIRSVTDWKPYELVLDVPDDVVQLVFGVMSFGTGRVWVDDFSLTVVGNEVAVTNQVTPERMNDKRDNSFLLTAKIPPQPRNLDFEGGANPLRKAVAVAPAVYDALLGDYANAMGRVLTVTKEANKLFIADSFGPKGEALPLSENEYFIRYFDPTFNFHRNAEGQVNELVVRANTTEIRYKKLDLAAAKTRGEQILAAARQAKGGADKLAAIRDLYFEATRVIAGTKTEHLNMFLSKQWEFREESTDAQTGALQIAFSDGQSLHVGNAKETREVSSQANSHVRRLIWLNFTLQPVAGDTLDVLALDDARVQDKPVEVVMVTTGNERYLLSFDKETHLLRRLTHPPSGLDYVYENFRTVDGIQFPHQANIIFSGQKVAATLHRFKLNAGIDPAKLIKP
ncbi:MAG TPA: hypothetical protein VFZ34_27490 [Blastocatellia bacterium]|nr:hypothetical protein [Blastocatellia bacterium]